MKECFTVYVEHLLYHLLLNNNEGMFHCLLGWVNLYQKFEIEKYTGCGKLILPKIKMVSLVLF